MIKAQTRFPQNWIKLLGKEFTFKIDKILNSVDSFFPCEKDIFKIFNILEPKDIKVIIIGQDPYYKKGQATGIAFSVENNIKMPPSLKNIFKELKNDLGIDHFKNSNLTGWVKQGVFLFNAIWTVENEKPGSHKNIGWIELTIELFDKLYEFNPHIIFCAWGNEAKNIIKRLRVKPINLIESSHPSPLGFYKGFSGSKPFSKINEILINNGDKKIDFTL
ncbi:uracil-DNA glycosylase [Spiroplasma endosymbiont of Crioceris asparagi]|uniref:uracil-DNA glycosylase n=1 Tax=Spiroplasma endosymbiont of Crioceris asparagi TaxID=3066286 RepID=UPI0030D1A678